jgi:integrase/recombinase XerC
VHISSFVAALSEMGLKPRSVNRKLSSIQSLFNYCIRNGLVETNPASNIKRPKAGSALPSFVREESLKSLFTEIDFPQDYEGQRDRLMITLFYTSGIRRDEMINLEIASLDFYTKSIKVLGKRNKERIIPLSKTLMDQLQGYIQLRNEIESNTEYLFVTPSGKKMYPSLVYKIVKKYLSLVTTMTKRSPHVLRHSFATHLLNEGANLQSIKELLGHSSLSATQVYTHTSLDKLKDVYRKSHPRNKK